MSLEVGDIVLCTVDRIVGTLVFVKIDREGEGSITLSEIAPGRIRNLRDHVVPKKKIVCKVLRIFGDRIDLSLRRVTQKEQKEVMAQYKQEKTYASIIKSVLKERAEEKIKEITEKERLYDFLEEAKEDKINLEKIVGKEDTEKILEILNLQKERKVIAKKELLLSTLQPNGLELIKELFSNIIDAEVKYISAGKYLIQSESTDPKSAELKINKIIQDLEKKTKHSKMEFKVK